MPRVFGRFFSGVLTISVVTLALAPLAARAASPYDISLGTSPGEVLVADFNRDGFPDLVVASAGAVTILLGHGDGTFVVNHVYASSQASPIAVGDINGDGKLDVVSGAMLMLGNGDGTFQQVFSNFGFNQIYGVTVGDVNGDGKLDVVTASFGQTQIFLGNGDGTFRPGAVYPYGFGQSRLADLNRDGRLDLVISDPAGTAILLGNGDGTFGSPVTRFINFGNDAVVGDLNGDGIPDIVTLGGSGNGCLNIAIGRGDGTFNRSFSCGLLGSPLALGDLDSDGHLDIFTGKYSSVWLRGNGDGTFGSPSAVIVGTVNANHHAAIADLNGDGHVDIVLTNLQSNSVSVLLGPVGPPVPGSATLSPSSLAFGSLPVWQTSAPQTVTLTSNGPGALTVGGWSGPVGYNVSSNCPVGGPLAAGLSCTFTIAFAPYRDGPLGGQLTVTDSDPASSLVTISGTGLINPTSIAVDSVTTAVGTPANFRAVVTSNGQPPLVGGQVVFHLPNGATFTSGVGPDGVAGYGGYNTSAFTPGFYPSGIRADFQGDTGYAASSGYADLTVTNQPTAPKIALSPALLDFGNVVVGSTAHGLVAITNSGTANYSFAGATATGDFSIPQINCPGPAAPGNSCYVYVDFKPSQVGMRSGNLTVTGNDPTSPDTSALTGVGVLPGISLSPGSVDFGAVPISTMATAAVTVTNTGTAPLNLAGYSVTGPDATSFQVAPGTCGVQVLPGAYCNLALSFGSAVRGSYTATLTISDDAPGAPHVVALAARAVASILSLAPNPLSFGNVDIGTTAHSVVTITNSGDADYHFSAATAAGDFTVPQVDCSATVAPGNSCVVHLDFRPSQSGTISGTLTVTGDDRASPDTSTLTGFGLLHAASLSPASIDFGQTLVTTTSTAGVGITNSGNTPLHITGYSISGADATSFHAGPDTCGVLVAPGASCNIAVNFGNKARGSYSAALTIFDDAVPAPQLVPLTARAVAPVVSLTPIALNFGNVNGGATASGLVTVTNVGDAPYHFGSAISAADFQVRQSTCAAPVAPGGSCSISVDFAPTLPGSRSSNLSVSGDDIGTPDQVGLSGNGVMPLAKLSAGTLSYIARNVGTSSSAQSVVVTNSGNAPLVVTSASVVGANGSDFRIASNGCASPLSAGATCSLGVVFSPSSYGSRTATLQLVDNSPDAIQRVTLSGVGIAPSLSVTPTSVDFGTKRVGQVTAGSRLTLTNVGNAPLQASSVAITGANPKDFASSGSNCPETLTAGSSCVVTMTFKPSALGTRSASLTFVTNGVPRVVSVRLTGIGSRS